MGQIFEDAALIRDRTSYTLVSGDSVRETLYTDAYQKRRSVCRQAFDMAERHVDRGRHRRHVAGGLGKQVSALQRCE
jgi:hypothetical protein